MTAQNTWGPAGLAIRRSGTTNYFNAYDPFGNGAEVYTGTTSPSLSTTSRYDAYGKLYSGSIPSADPYAGFGGQWGYYNDTTTGWNLAGHRFYMPGQARWLNRDPIGYSGGIDLYGYVGDSPANRIDPSGFGGGDEGKDDDDGIYSSENEKNAVAIEAIIKTAVEGAEDAWNAAGNVADRINGIDDTPLPCPGTEFPEYPAPSAPPTTDLSPYRQTGPGEQFYRYESGHPGYTKVTPGGGLMPGTFTAPDSDGIIPQGELADTYNLPDPTIPRGVVFTVTPPPGTWVEGSRPVAGGTGGEVISTFGAPPGKRRPCSAGAEIEYHQNEEQS